MPSKTKDHVVHAGLSLQLLPLKELSKFQLEHSITFLNKNLLIALEVFTEMKAVTEDGWMKLSHMSSITRSPLNQLIHILERTELVDLHHPK